jgi:hypothetical protein
VGWLLHQQHKVYGLKNKARGTATLLRDVKD